MVAALADVTATIATAAMVMAAADFILRDKLLCYYAFGVGSERSGIKRVHCISSSLASEAGSL